MSEPIETIYYEQVPVAMIIPSGQPIDGVSYVTDPNNALQIGLHHRQKGKTIQAHTHAVSPTAITEIQEVLLILSGSIKISLYTMNKQLIATRILRQGDSVLLMREGHQIEYLEETRMFEVKQGPYKQSKVFISGK